MAVKEILKMGHPLLYEKAQRVVNFSTPELDALVRDMFDTMAANDGAGLAAPQIGVPLRVVIFGVEANPRYPDVEPVPTTVLINPEITVLDATEEGAWEGCLSVPGLRGLVYRPRRIRYVGRDVAGKPIEREAEGFHARVVQHEVDHLDGILFPFRLADLRHFVYEEEMKFHQDDA